MEHIQGQYTYHVFLFGVGDWKLSFLCITRLRTVVKINVNLMQNPIKFKYLMKQSHDLNIVFTILFFIIHLKLTDILLLTSLQ